MPHRRLIAGAQQLRQKNKKVPETCQGLWLPTKSGQMRVSCDRLNLIFSVYALIENFGNFVFFRIT